MISVSEESSIENRLAKAAELSDVENYSWNKALRIENVLDIVRKLKLLDLKFFENKLKDVLSLIFISLLFLRFSEN